MNKRILALTIAALASQSALASYDEATAISGKWYNVGENTDILAGADARIGFTNDENLDPDSDHVADLLSRVKFGVNTKINDTFTFTAYSETGLDIPNSFETDSLHSDEAISEDQSGVEGDSSAYVRALYAGVSSKYGKFVVGQNYLQSYRQTTYVTDYLWAISSSVASYALNVAPYAYADVAQYTYDSEKFSIGADYIFEGDGGYDVAGEYRFDGGYTIGASYASIDRFSDVDVRSHTYESTQAAISGTYVYNDFSLRGVLNKFDNYDEGLDTEGFDIVAQYALMDGALDTYASVSYMTDDDSNKDLFYVAGTTYYPNDWFAVSLEVKYMSDNELGYLVGAFNDQDYDHVTTTLSTVFYY